MMSRLADLAVSTTFAGSLLLANTSCATRHSDGAATSAPRSETQVPGVQHLVQFSFGTQAAFGALSRSRMKIAGLPVVLKRPSST